MPLPKVEYPIFNIRMPSTGNDMKFRPMLVKEEKILLMAKESDDDSDIMLSVKQVVQNCCLEDNFDVDNITLFDLEYFFINIRSNSIQNIIELKYIDNEDGKEYAFSVDLNKIQIKNLEKPQDMNIKINDSMGIIMKYPTVSILSDKNFMNKVKTDNSFITLLTKCIDRIYDKDKNYLAKDFNDQEIEEFLNNLGVKFIDELTSYLEKSPKLEHLIEYKNSLGNDRKIFLRNLNDFFMFR